MKCKRRKQIGTVLTVCFIAMLSTTVYAGDINSAEQMVINYYNGTFTHNGKQYVATEAAKASAYNKLAADDVDLTTSQAKAAIRQASGQIEEGIAQGYLVEVTNTENPGTEVPSTESGQNPGTSGENVNAGNPGNEDGSGKQNEPSDTEPGTELVKPTEPVDVGGLIEDVPEDGDKYVNVQTEPNGGAEFIPGQTEELPETAITVEQYIDGELTAVTDEGTLLFKGSLPIKNTGYYTGMLEKVLMGMGLVFGVTLVAGVVYILRARRKQNI